MNFAIAVALIAGATSPLATQSHTSVVYSDVVKERVIKGIYKNREDTENWLRQNTTSYFATVQRRDFEQRSTLSVGRDASNDVRLEAEEVEPHHLRVAVVGDSFRVETVGEKARFKIGAVEHRERTVAPSTITVGRYTLRLSHQRYPAIIVFDPRSPRMEKFRGLKHYPVDLAYRYALPLIADPEPDTVTILSTRGNLRHAIRVGWFDFVVDGKRCRLEATRLLEPGQGENDLGVFFRDATSGKETYRLGRYIDVKQIPGSEDYLLDFNLAYNPACAFSEHYNCPVPPKTNSLKVAIRAGEKDSHYH
jgi:uncharacterized protein (DUF1684 family)